MVSELKNLLKNIIVTITTRGIRDIVSGEIILLCGSIKLKKFKSFEELNKWLPQDTIRYTYNNEERN